MAKSLAQLEAQIEQLKKEADALRQQEVAGVIERIREAINAYQLTPADLFPSRQGKRTRAAASNNTGTAARRTGSKPDQAVKFRDPSGNTWGGRGPRPRWLREALANGATLEQFAA